MDIGNSILLHTEFERGKSIANNGGLVHVILNRQRLGFTSNVLMGKTLLYSQLIDCRERKTMLSKDFKS